MMAVERRVGQERVDHDRRAGKIDAKGRMAEPGKSHHSLFRVVATSGGQSGKTSREGGGNRPVMVKAQTAGSIEQLVAAVPAGPLMGLDLGTRTIGIAISDPGRRIATPLMVIRRSKFTADAAQLVKQIAIHRPVGLVVGLPINMDGSEGARAQATRAFVRNFAGISDLPIAFWDERLSTAAVTRTLLEADASRKRRGEVVDKMAAAYILQGALDRMASLSGAPRAH